MATKSELEREIRRLRGVNVELFKKIDALITEKVKLAKKYKELKFRMDGLSH